VIATVGLRTHMPSMPPELWVASSAARWVCSLLVAAFELLVG
jgi:hypothetical protein